MRTQLTIFWIDSTAVGEAKKDKASAGRMTGL